MEETKLSKEEAEQQLSNKTTEMNFAAEWPASATVEEEDGMGDLVDLPTDEEEVQPRRLQKES
jgi:hypothetical protein